MKWFRRFSSEQNSRWGRVIHSRYGLSPNSWDTPMVRRQTFRSPWKFISSCIHIQFKVGDGFRIRFQEDLWIGNSTLNEHFSFLYRVAESKNVCISSLRFTETFTRPSGFPWNLCFFRNLNEREMDQVSDLISLLDYVIGCDDVDDRRVWKLESFEMFSSIFIFGELTMSDVTTPFHFYSFIWISFLARKVKVFCQLLSLGKLNTQQILQKRKPFLTISTRRCVLYRNRNRNYVSLYCPSFMVTDVVGVWVGLGLALKLSGYSFACLKDWRFDQQEEEALECGCFSYLLVTLARDE